jgi:hypothetical protein
LVSLEVHRAVSLPELAQQTGYVSLAARLFLCSPLFTQVPGFSRCLAIPLEVVGKKWGEGVSVSPARGSGRKEQRSMHARVTTLEVPPDRIDVAKRNVREQVLPRLSQMEGFKGMVALGSGQSGKLQGVAFWESEEALRATDQSVVPVREGVAEAAGGTVAGVEEFEVFVFEAPSTGPVSGVTDTVRGATVNLLGGGEKQR